MIFFIRLTSKFHTYFKFKIVRSWFFRNLALWVVIFRILVGGGHLLYPYSTHILIRKRSNLFVISKKGGPGLHVTYFLSLHSWSFLYKIYYFPSFPSFFCLTLLFLRRICCSISHFFVCVESIQELVFRNVSPLGAEHVECNLAWASSFYALESIEDRIDNPKRALQDEIAWLEAK